MSGLQMPAVSSDTKVTLYHKFCSCHQDFTSLYQFLGDIKDFPLVNYMVKRVELNLEWQKEVAELGLELPVVVFVNGEEKIAMTYKDFLLRYLGDAKPHQSREDGGVVPSESDNSDLKSGGIKKKRNKRNAKKVK